MPSIQVYVTNNTNEPLIFCDSSSNCEITSRPDDIPPEGRNVQAFSVYNDDFSELSVRYWVGLEGGTRTCSLYFKFEIAKYRGGPLGLKVHAATPSGINSIASCKIIDTSNNHRANFTIG